MALLLGAIVLFMPMVVRRINIRTATFAVTTVSATSMVTPIMVIGTVVAAKMILFIVARIIVEVVCRVAMIIVEVVGRQLCTAAFVSTATRVIISTVAGRVVVISITITMAVPRVLRVMRIEIRLIPRVLRITRIEIRLIPRMVSVVDIEVLRLFWIEVEAAIGIAASFSFVIQTLVPIATVTSTVSTITMCTL